MLKHFHMTLAAISISLFTLRFFWTLANSPKLQTKWVKITPHIVDTLLLTIGVIMAVQYYINPLEQLWLAEILWAVVGCIFSGSCPLKVARSNRMQIMGYLGAIGWVMLIVRLAMTREAMLLS